MSDGYTDMHVHCVPRDGAVSFRGWRRLVEPVLVRSAGTHGSGPQATHTYMDRLAERLRAASQVRRAVLLDSALDRELGFDSLSRVELLLRFERAFGISMPEQLLASAEPHAICGGRCSPPVPRGAHWVPGPVGPGHAGAGRSR